MSLVLKVGRCWDCPFFFHYHTPHIGCGCRVDDALEFLEEEAIIVTGIPSQCPLRKSSVRVEIKTTESAE